MRGKKNEYVIAKDRVKLNVGDVIRLSCKLMEMSQSELARQSGIAESHISAIINGKRKIGKIIAEKLAKPLNVSPSFILFAGEKSREGADLDSGINTALLEQAIQTVEENKNKDTHVQLATLRMAVEFIAKAILSVSYGDLAPIDLIARPTKHAHTTYGKRKH